jgi:hypothetical protein
MSPVKFPWPVSGLRTFGSSRLVEHRSYHDESRDIEGGQRPEITKAQNDESPKNVRALPGIAVTRQ